MTHPLWKVSYPLEVVEGASACSYYLDLNLILDYLKLMIEIWDLQEILPLHSLVDETLTSSQVLQTHSEASENYKCISLVQLRVTAPKTAKILFFFHFS